MTDLQIITAILKLDWHAKRALAEEMETTERTIYRWSVQPPNNPHVRAALEKALGGKR